MNICLSYGSRQEIVNACKSVAQSVLSGNISVDDINESLLESRFKFAGQPGFI